MLAALTIMAAGLVRRDDVPDSEYRVSDSEYPGVFPFPVKGSCAATLLTPTAAISAAHCFDGSGEHNASPPFTVSINGQTHTVQSVVLNPCYDLENSSPNSADVAILFLQPAVSGVTPHPRYESSDEVGKEFVLIGWGDFGPGGGSEPPECAESSEGCSWLREGENRFTGVGNGGLLQYVLDSPLSVQAPPKHSSP